MSKRAKVIDMKTRKPAVAGGPPDFSLQPARVTELGFEVAVTESLEQRGIYDASRLRERKPEVFRACEKMLGRGIGVDIISDLLQLDPRTIAAVREAGETSGVIPGHKEQTVKRLRSLACLMLDKMEDKVRDGEFTFIDFGIVVDKIELLSGGVTARVEVQVSEGTDDFLRLVRQARQAQGMVLEAEEGSAKGPAALEAGRSEGYEDAGKVESLGLPTGDLESPGNKSQTVDNER